MKADGRVEPFTAVVTRLDRVTQYPRVSRFIDGGDYWIPAFAGKTAIVMGGRDG